MKERPIPFNTPMVRAILDGRKTQTRRIVIGHPGGEWTNDVLGRITSKHPKQGRFGLFVRRGIGTDFPECDLIPCPYGQPGDRLWVRESARVMAVRGGIREIDIEYQADGTKATVKYPSRLAPAPLGKLLSNGTYREASRILLEITAVRVERLQDISEANVWAEGIEKAKSVEGYAKASNGDGTADVVAPAFAYRRLWESINGPDSWNANPLVWVVEFKRRQA